MCTATVLCSLGVLGFFQFVSLAHLLDMGGGGGLVLMCVVWASLLLTSIGSEHMTVLFFSFFFLF